MEHLTISKKDAQTAHDNANNKGKKLLEDLLGKKNFQKEVFDRVKTFQDVLLELGNNDNDVKEYMKLIGIFSDGQNHILNYQRAVLICKALNEGWTPDWTNSNEPKYQPWFKMGSPSGGGFSYDGCDHWLTRSNVGSRLCFKSSKLAQYAGEQFEEIYKHFLTLNS